jgi:ribosome-associated translation inhibitor RaiA
MSYTQALQVETVTRGAVPEDAMDLAVLRVRAELRAAREPVLFAKIKLAVAADPSAGQPAVAQASVDVNGRRVRAQVAAETMRAAIELMCQKLKVRLERAAEQGIVAVGRAEAGGPGCRPDWRLPQPRRPVEAPSLVRHKSYGLARLTPDEAIADLEMLDYEFHLFTERATDTDSVVYLTEDGYRIAQVDPRPDVLELETVSSAVTVSGDRAPRLELAEAEARLEALGRPFVFFVNNRTGRGNLIYHRYDGHYGLITPADG